MKPDRAVLVLGIHGIKGKHSLEGRIGQNSRSVLTQPAVRMVFGYAVVAFAGVILFLLILDAGLGISAPKPINSRVSTAPTGAPSAALPEILLGLAVIVIAARAVGTMFKRIKQPPVIGEVVAGILLGPSLFGRIAPNAFHAVFPPTAVPALGIIAQVGVILFMFIVGLEVNPDRLKDRTRSAMAISQAGIICPFLLGSALALYLYPRLSSSDVPFTAFALFLGISMSVTAFPVLARILTDRGIQRSQMGLIALTSAAINDATAWCLLAFVVGVVRARLGGAFITSVLTVAYIGLMFMLVRPYLHRRALSYSEGNGHTQQMMTLVFGSLLLSCLATEYIGIHALFGAFLLGAAIPHDSWIARTITDKLNDFVLVLLLPAFFALTGLRTQIGLIDGDQWLTCLLIILVAFAGKFGGASFAARLSGLGWKDSAALGILMNTRGLMELIVLNVGLDLKVISPTLFAMLVIMAVVTTLATSPILDRLISPHWIQIED